ncbi:MAG: DUF4276 family protein [Fimbriimonadales bacterium]|nr:DUF4276 family protein [Fimbriimonadales bacterium]GIV13736.1 MAG: hypothetical protein KatS3mg021_2018 [Fimbriimonadales bacterium]
MSILLWLVVEGSDDERFIERIIKPLLANHSIQTYRWAQKSRQQRTQFIQNIQKLDCAYFVLADKDTRPCIRDCKAFVQQQFGGVVPAERIVVVDGAIEAWYLAGFTGSPYLRGIQPPARTDGITKQMFLQQYVPAGKLPSSVLEEMLANYDLALARQHNHSLEYFCRRLGIL